MDKHILSREDLNKRAVYSQATHPRKIREKDNKEEDVSSQFDRMRLMDCTSTRKEETIYHSERNIYHTPEKCIQEYGNQSMPSSFESMKSNHWSQPESPYIQTPKRRPTIPTNDELDRQMKLSRQQKVRSILWGG